MTVESEAPTDILVSDLVMTDRMNITNNNTIESIMFVWNRVVLHPLTLHSKIYRRIYKSDTGDSYLPKPKTLFHLSYL